MSSDSAEIGITGDAGVAAMRATAHPTRVRILELLRRHPSLTATECATMLDLTPKTCSYHLLTLASVGLISEIAVTGRNRPWRLTSLSQATNSAFSTSRKTDVHQRREESLLHRAAAAITDSAGTPWAEAATVHNHIALMSPDEVKAWCDDVERLTRRHARRSHDDAGSAGRVPVQLMFIGFPGD